MNAEFARHISKFPEREILVNGDVTDGLSLSRHRDSRMIDLTAHRPGKGKAQRQPDRETYAKQRSCSFNWRTELHGAYAAANELGVDRKTAMKYGS
jgi:hypothetical protein